MNSRLILLLCVLAAVFLSGTFLAAQTADTSAASDPLSLVKQGQKLNSEGKQDEALALYRQALEKSPNLYEAHLASGIALDLKGDYAEARNHLNKAIELAPADKKDQALRTMAVSYAFESNAREAEQYEQKVFDARAANRISWEPPKLLMNSPASNSSPAIRTPPIRGTSAATTPLFARLA